MGPEFTIINSHEDGTKFILNGTLRYTKQWISSDGNYTNYTSMKFFFLDVLWTQSAKTKNFLIVLQ